ncbi:MAG: dihydroorotate dehydrogenase [bacterium]|nr:dihydroorotate dehydrogenase [bacterium]
MDLYPINSVFPVTNAAGHCKDEAEVRRLASSTIGGIVVGSVTVKQREGNPGQTFYQEGPWTLNSIGLRNPGLGYYERVGPNMVRQSHKFGKPIIMSGAGSNPEEYVALANSAADIGFDGFEVNVGCSNVVDGGKRHRIVSFDPRMVKYILTDIFKLLNGDGPFVTVKVTPMTDPERIIELADELALYPIRAVVTMNAVPNGLLFNDRNKPAIQTPDATGWAGFSGPAVKPFALGQVNQWRRALPQGIEVWGVGGVSVGKDVHDMLRAGASVVQVGTAYFSHSDGAKFFGGLATQFLGLA